GIPTARFVPRCAADTGSYGSPQYMRISSKEPGHGRRMMRAAGLVGLGGLVASLTAGAVTATWQWSVKAHSHSWLPLHLTLFVAAGLAWALTLAVLPRLARRPGDLRVIWVLALAVRIPAWLGTPVHSDDVYRYAWDGRVMRAGINPYRYPPAAPELD